ncbi:peptidylprolyl isomerase [Coraliomargarita algicola]|uniref:Peptidylprolyl isomerase n=1 Tax=Coraliomargarita algicola TaxID=3092156 RepID=A0ABZ0RRW2_9BACT|nr:peptidylprolyl isomerase [Coraliomargarita sp. J2-16]WPJ97918.1 peptidylprolyl isomerase [Coraliomargarita sp. J2-16]
MLKINSSAFSKYANEPLLHFLVLALVIAWWMGLRAHDERPVIQITEATIAGLVEAYESDPRVTPGSVDTERLVAQHLRYELLYQEALQYEAYRKPYLRKALIREMQRELEPVIAEPSEADLRNYWTENATRYRTPPSVAFEHVSFPPDQLKIPADLRNRLNAGEPSEHFGQAIRLANPIPLTFLPALKLNLGESAAEQIMACEPGNWTGPIRSKIGTHFIRVIRKNSTGEQPFEQIRSTVKGHWINEQIKIKMEQRLAEIARQYQLELPAAYQDLRP